MSRRKKPSPLLENILITDVATEGEPLARINGMVVFVSFAIPGNVVDLQVRKKRYRYCEVEVVRFIKYSDVRRTPKYQHFGIYGGCKWQMSPYEEQLKVKQKQIRGQLRRIGEIELPEFRPIMESEKTYEYRDKLEFSCSSKRRLTWEEVTSDVKYDRMSAIGFHITGTFDRVYPTEKCWLMDDLCNQIRNCVRGHIIDHDISFFDLRIQAGLLCDIMIRNANTGEWMVPIQFKFQKEGDEQHAHGPLQHMADSFPQITSLLYVDNQKCNDTFGDQTIVVFRGKDHIMETMGDPRFRVAVKSFYRTNTNQAYHLYSAAREFAQLTSKELVYGLYTGTGIITNFVAREVWGTIDIEYVGDAIEDAKVNSTASNIHSAQFYAGDMKDILTEEFITEHGRPNVIITSPPHASIHPGVVRTILGAAPQHTVYVNCNPATRARDLQMLDKQYKVIAVRPTDMSSHTPHIGNVVLLEQC